MLSPPSLRSKEQGSFGQSLVETALFLPLLIFLLAGVLELSNLLVTQNRVASAARAGTRFAAANFGPDQWAAWDSYASQVAYVALNNVTETLDLDPARWDIWVIKATVGPGKPASDPEGEWFLEWEPVHVDDGDAEGVEPVMAEDEWLARESDLKAEVRAALDTVPVGTKIVATDAYHHRNAFLGLAPYNLGPFTRIRGFTVMRVDETGGTYGSCDTFPIAMSLDNWSLYPSDYEGTLPPGRERFPSAEIWSKGYWSGKPESQPHPVYTTANKSQFPYNVPNRHVTEAHVGDIFLTKQAGESEPSAFGWLRWDSDPSGGNANALAESLRWPGNSHTYSYPPWSDDGRIDRYDLVKVATGSMSSAEPEMQDHVEAGVDGRLLRFIVFTPTGAPHHGDANGDGHRTGGSGSGRDFEVYGFVLARIVGYYLPGQHNWLVLEFHGWDVECGPTPATPTPATPAYP